VELLERADLLRTLASQLDQAERGRGRLVLLHGEAGIGKTAVVRRFAALAGARAKVLVGGCDPLSTPRPLGPLVDVAGGLGPTVRPALDVALSGVGGANPVFRALLAELAVGPRPTVLIFEDVHWADGATLDLLRYLSRRIEHTPILLINTYRDDEIGRDHPLAALLGDLAGSGVTSRCAVEPLSPAAVAAMAAGRSVDADTLYRNTRGNPFFVTEALASPTRAVPTSVHEAVLGRIARWPAPARAVADLVAVIGSPAPLRLLAAVLPDATSVLRAGVIGGVLQVADHTVSFRHELARLAVLADIPAYQRIDLHAQVLAELRAGVILADQLPRLAYHAEESGDAAAVLEYAPWAAERADAVGAHREVAAQYGRALRHAANQPPGKRAELLERQAYAYYLTGSITEAISAWRQAGQLRDRLGDRTRQGDDLRWMSYMLWLLGRNTEAKQLGLRAVSVLEEVSPGQELARAYTNLAEQASYDCDPHSTRYYAQRVIELDRQLDEPSVVVRARFHAAIATVFWRDEGWDELDELWRTATEQHMIEHAGMFGPVLSAVATVHRDFARAALYDERAVALCRDYDLDMFLGYLRGARAIGLLHRGLWDLAADEADGALRLYSLPPVSRPFPLAALALVRARRGDPDSWPLLDEAIGLGESTDLIRLGPVWEARAEAAWLAGDDDAVLAEAGHGLGLATADSDPWAVGGLARWIRLSGSGPPAVRAAGPFTFELSGDWRAAAQAWDELGCPYDAALARLAGDVPAVGEALEIFESLGARPAARRARERLKAMGVRYGTRGPRAPARAHPHGLTAREQEVLTLLREGLTGPQIAARMCISPKTANHHVTAILAKLGVHSRAEAIRKFAE
jgi:DNA-binding CsgD family transcriptional regulator